MWVHGVATNHRPTTNSPNGLFKLIKQTLKLNFMVQWHFMNIYEVMCSYSRGTAAAVFESCCLELLVQIRTELLEMEK